MQKTKKALLAFLYTSAFVMESQRSNDPNRLSIIIYGNVCFILTIKSTNSSI